MASDSVEGTLMWAIVTQGWQNVNQLHYDEETLYHDLLNISTHLIHNMHTPYQPWKKGMN